MARNQNTDKAFDISRGNRKMAKGFLIWNMPEKKTCPGSTAICRKYCYACKASRIYQNVAESRERNFSFVRSNPATWTDTLIRAIDKLAQSKTFNGFFRIHEAGDFYSQDYLDGWIVIARAFPEIRFLAFTKSFHLDFSRVPSNMNVIMSVMPDTDVTTVPAGFYRAFAGEVADMPSNVFPCPGSCDGCGMCWRIDLLGRDVHFHMH